MKKRQLSAPVSALALFAVIGITACDRVAGPSDPAKPGPSVSERAQPSANSASAAGRKEAEQIMKDLAGDGDETMRLVVALKEHRPDVYEEFVEKLGDLIDREAYDYETSYAAGAELRPKVIEAFGDAMLTASDANLNRLVAHTTDAYGIILKKDPQECMRNINGLPPLDADVIPDPVQKRETDLMIDIFEEGPVSGTDTASQDELMAWMVPLLQANPQHMEAFGIPTTGQMSNKDAARFCRATIFVMEELLKMDEAESASLFRGMSLLE